MHDASSTRSFRMHGPHATEPTHPSGSVPPVDAQAPVGPKDYKRIGLVASPTLRRGAASSFARLVRELTPYLVAHEPDIYMPEGTYRAIFTCGLLRRYPPGKLHCLASGRLGGLADLGAGVVDEDVAGLEHTLGPEADMQILKRKLDLDWGLDCVVYLLDPGDPTSSLPGTLALKRECLVARKPFLGTYASAVEWFTLLDGDVGATADRIGRELAASLGYEGGFPHETIALVAHDASKKDMVEYARHHVPFLNLFGKRLATNTTGRLLSGDTSVAGDDEALSESVTKLQAALEDHEFEKPWVQALKSGPRGGDLQIGEAVAMGLCDATLFFEDTQIAHQHDADIQLFERSARIANHADQLGKPAQLMCLHDPDTASKWALLWQQALDANATLVTLVGAYRELFDIDLVLAPSPPDDSVRQWETILVEAAWYVLSAISGKQLANDRREARKRVTLGAGGSVNEVLRRIPVVAGQLSKRITDHQGAREVCLRECLELVQDHRKRRVVDLIAARKGLTLRPSALPAAMWNIAPIIAAPMIGGHASPDPAREARGNARLLVEALGGERIRFGDSAFAHRHAAPRDFPPPDVDYHWHNTDIALMSCGDLRAHWFTENGKVPLPVDMWADLNARGCCCDLSGIYLNAAGVPVAPMDYVRHGMKIDDLRAVARTGDGRASILVAGGDTPPESEISPQTPRTILAALRSKAVSVWVTDRAYAIAVLRLWASDLQTSK